MAAVSRDPPIYKFGEGRQLRSASNFSGRSHSERNLCTPCFWQARQVGQGLVQVKSRCLTEASAAQQKRRADKGRSVGPKVSVSSHREGEPPPWRAIRSRGNATSCRN